MTSESDTLARLLDYHDHIDVPPVAIEDDVRRGRRRVRRTKGLIAGGAALAVATVVATIFLPLPRCRVLPRPRASRPSRAGLPRSAMASPGHW